MSGTPSPASVWIPTQNDEKLVSLGPHETDGWVQPAQVLLSSDGAVYVYPAQTELAMFGAPG